MKYCSSRIIGTVALVTWIAWAAPAFSVAQCESCGDSSQYGTIEGAACDDGSCGSASGQWKERWRAKCAACDGDGTFCHQPAPRYPVPFTTPRPTVPTHFTYPPLMPHHSLPHYRHTYSYHHSCGLARTNVRWQPNYPVAAFKRVHHFFELPR